MIEVMSKFQRPTDEAYSISSLVRVPLQVEGYHFSPSGKFILIIDDSPTIQRIVEMTLRREGHEIRPFGDGVEAMRWFARPEARVPDLMLVDLGLPKIDGYDVIQKFKAKPCFADTVCIILSRRDGIVDKLKGKIVGATAYITKPFTTQELVTTIQTSMASKCMRPHAGE
jgi:twitching motility two-component system response regulator PilG